MRVDTLRNGGAEFSVLSRHENITAPSMTLPSEVFHQLDVPMDAEIDLIFGFYESPLMFNRAKQENSNFAVASALITATIPSHDVGGLDSDVIITLPLLSEVSLTT